MTALAEACADCGKRRYLGKAAAEAAALDMSRRLRAYPCSSGYWHLTSHRPERETVERSPTEKRRARRKRSRARKRAEVAG